jgi:hypothetical protein
MMRNEPEVNFDVLCSATSSVVEGSTENIKNESIGDGVEACLSR